MSFFKLKPKHTINPRRRTSPRIMVSSMGKRLATSICVPEEILAEAGLIGEGGKPPRVDLYVGDGPDLGWLALAGGKTYRPFRNGPSGRSWRVTTTLLPAAAKMRATDAEYRIKDGIIAVKLPSAYRYALEGVAAE